MTEQADDVLADIDAALEGWHGRDAISPDAMRWAPEPPAAPRRDLTPEEIEQITAELRQLAQGFVAGIRAAFGPGSEFAERWKRMAATLQAAAKAIDPVLPPEHRPGRAPTRRQEENLMTEQAAGELPDPDARLASAGWRLVNETRDGWMISEWRHASGENDTAAWVGLVHGEAAEAEYRRVAALSAARAATRQLVDALGELEQASAQRRRGQRQVALLLMVAAALLLVAQLARIASYVWSVLG